MLWIFMIFQNIGTYILKKFEAISGAITFIYLGYLFCNTDVRHNLDYSLYLNSYNLGWNNFEIGYITIAKMANMSGISFAEFRMFLGILIFTLLFLGIRLITKRVSIVSAVYAIIGFPLDTIQIRNGILTAFIVWGFYFINKENIKANTIAILLMVLASFFHTLAFLFLMLFIVIIVVRKYTTLKGLRYILSGTFFLSIIMMLLGKNLIFSSITLLTSKIGIRQNLSSNISNVYSQGIQLKVWILIFGLSILVAMGLYYFSKYFINNDINQIKMVYILILALIITLILLVLSVDFIRVLRILLLVIVLFIANKLDYNKVSIGLSSLIAIYILVVSMIFLYIQVDKVYLIGVDFQYIIRLIDSNIIG